MMRHERPYALTADRPVIVFDHTTVAQALAECAARRARNESFFVRPVLPREKTLRADAVAASILQSMGTLDERRVAFEQAAAGVLPVNGGTPLHTLVAYAPHTIRLVQATLRLCDGLAVSSHAERRRIQEIVQTDAPFVTLTAAASMVPAPSGSPVEKPDAVVIWAPHMPGDVAAALVVALSDLRLPLLLVSHSAPSAPGAWNWVAPAAAESALARARVIVDANPHGCDDAVPLAAWGVPLVADAESGAQEVLDGVRVFDRGRFFSIFEAVVSALGKPASTVRDRLDTQIALPGLLQDGPLVSVILYTYDRPVLLRYALQSVCAQTYRNVETIVAVDGGPRLDALAAEFPGVTFIHLKERDIVTTANTAFAAARGKYVTILNDDDMFFPNHVAELATALERSGAAVAHGDVLTAFLRGDDSRWMLYGFESNMSNAADLAGLLVNNAVGATSGMFLRNCFPENEPFDRTIPLYRDYELWLRLCTRFDFVHVERITSCYTIRNSGAAQQSVQFAHEALAAYQAIYARYPVPGRPVLEQRRAHTLQNTQRGHVGPSMAPAAEIAPLEWPLTVS